METAGNCGADNADDAVRLIDDLKTAVTTRLMRLGVGGAPLRIDRVLVSTAEENQRQCELLNTAFGVRAEPLVIGWLDWTLTGGSAADPLELYLAAIGAALS